MQTRRTFIKSVASGMTFAAVARSRAEEAKPSDIPIIDTHVHLWDLSKFSLPWVAKGSVLDRNFLLADYAKAAEGLDVVKGVYMEVAVAPEQRAAEARYVLELCRAPGAFLAGATIGGDVAGAGFVQYLDTFKGDPHLTGVRQITRDILAPDFIRGVRALGERGLRFDLHPGMARLPDAAQLADACPGTRFILDHCGNADAQAKPDAIEKWKRDLADLARRKNVVAAKISGIVATAPERWTPDDLAPFINHVLDTFGPDRVVFAGDWPVCTRRASLKQWVDALKKIVAARSLEEQRKLFHDNAVRVYELR